MKIVYIGSGIFGIECLNALAQSGHDLRFIVTGPAKPAGRGRKSTPTSVAQWAIKRSIPYMETKEINAPKTIEKIASYEPDFIVVIAFGYYVGSTLMTLGPKGSLNVHSSLLPKYRGAAPINWAIINGEKQTGVSIISLAKIMDTGCVLAQTKTKITEDETAGELHDRLAIMAAPLLIETLDKIQDDTAVSIAQDDSKASLAPKLTKSDGFLDFEIDAAILKRKIHGLWPWPGSAAIYVSKKTKKSFRVSIARVKVVNCDNPQKLTAGTLDENLNVICEKDAIKIVTLKPAGCNLMAFKDFVNGRATKPGDKFIKIT